MTNNIFNLGNEWALKEGAQKLDVQIFFRGIGGVQDTIMTLAKLNEAGVYIHQYAMVDGIRFKKDMPYMCSGEATLGITTHYMPEQTDYIDNIYKVLLSMNHNPSIAEHHWLNDHDQYSKIQIRHQVNDGEFTKWVDWNFEKQAEEAA